jgi:hypothetical protein
MIQRILTILLLSVLMSSGCVTQTERVPYHRYVLPPKDEGIIEELQREFGWQPSPHRDPFYTRAARSVKETVSGWFTEQEDPQARRKKEQEQAQRQFEQQQQEAFRRLRESQEQGKTTYESIQ